MRGERLDDEGVEGTRGLLDSHGLASTFLDPSSGGLPLLVEAEETGLSSSLDELIGLTDELVGEDPVGKTVAGLDGRVESLSLGIPKNCGRKAQRCLNFEKTHLSSPLDLGDSDGVESRVAAGSDGDGGAVKVVRDELLGVVLADGYINTSQRLALHCSFVKFGRRWARTSRRRALEM